MQPKRATRNILEILVFNLHLCLAVSSKPSVVLIVADDLGFSDLSCYGNDKIKTNNLDKLANEGIKFNRMYSTSSDSASMAAIMTGVYPQRLGLSEGSLGWSSFWSQAQSGGLAVDDPNMASLFSTKRHQAVFMGRWDLGAGVRGRRLPGGIGFMSFYGTAMSHSPGCTSDKTFRFTDWDYYLRILNENKYLIMSLLVVCVFPRLCGVKRNVSLIFLFMFGGVSLLLIRLYCWMGPLNQNSCILYRDNVINEQPYQDEKMTQRITHEAVNFLKYRRSKTFLLTVSYLQPRYPTFASKNFKNLSKISPYYDAVLEIDWSVGQILKTIENEGITNETLVIFVSDNGIQKKDIFTGRKLPSGMNGQSIVHYKKEKINLKGEKGSCFEAGIRVPAIARWPGHIKPGTQTDVVTSLMDIFPTVREVTNIKQFQFHTFDGKNLVPLFDSPKQKSNTIHNNLFHTCHHSNSDSNFAVTSGDIKVHFINCKPAEKCKTSKTTLIYNISADPGETTALSPKEHAGILYNIQLDMARTDLSFDGNKQDKQSQFDEIPFPWNIPCAAYNYFSCYKELEYKENFNSLLPS